MFVTPEGVDLRLQVGTAGERAGAFMLDFLIIMALLTGLTLLAAGAAFLSRLEWAELAFVVWVLVSFLIRNGYFLYFELRPGAATPGKRVVGLRVASRDGGRLRAEAVFARNVMREIELYLPLSFLATSFGELGWVTMVLGFLWAGVFLFLPVFNRDKLRAGDLVAGTWVVRAPKSKLKLDLSSVSLEPVYAFTTAQLDAYGVTELQVLEDVLRARDVKVMREVRERIVRRIAYTEPVLADADFLRAYYAGLRGRLEQRLLFGRRKRDKFDVDAR